MQALRLQYRKMDLERYIIVAGMTFMETAGIILLICGILGVKPF